MKLTPEVPLDGLTPEELAVRSQHGSVEAYARLVAIFEARLFNFLLRKVGNRVDAEDLTQEAFLRAWRRIGSYRSRWKFSTWLYTIASRLAISHARQRGSGRVVRIADEDQRETPREAVVEDRAWVWRLVDEVLTEEQRTAVWLRYVEDMGIGEIAAVMGKSHVGVRVMLFRARSVLAEQMESSEGKRGGGAEAAANVVTTGRVVGGGVR